MQSARCSSLLPLFFGSGIMAIVDAAIQSAKVGSEVFAAVLSFNLLGAWMICALICLISTVLSRFVNTSDKSFSIGLIIGAMPLLHSALPFPFSHLAFLALIGLCLRFKTISNPPLMACGATSIALAVVAALSLTLNHDFPPHPTAPISAKEQHQGPDVILISIDTLRADAIFSNQDLGLELPTLAKLRKESMWADYALSSSNQTLPGHLGMLSGLSATSHGVRSNRDLPDPSIPLAAELFAIKGYQTAAVISNALLSSATGMHRGFSHFSDEPIGLARMSL
ncbi:MAG: alkaline phosphatase family protein, partial [Planctomycetota bacterium]|nr:alkaline phosphatase family protein [Planctomycetota bacterium]